MAGTKDDSGKLRWDLVDWGTLAGMVKIMTFGVIKYGDRNWEQGLLWGRVFGAMMRHLTVWWMAHMRGEDGTDPETGESHLDHAMCCLHFLRTYEKRGMTDFDDRPGSPYLKD